VKMFRRGATPKVVATIPVGYLPHGIWPSGDGSRVYVALENGEMTVAINNLKQQSDRSNSNWADDASAGVRAECSARLQWYWLRSFKLQVTESRGNINRLKR